MPPRWVFPTVVLLVSSFTRPLYPNKLSPNYCEAAHSTRRSTPRRSNSGNKYDRSITTFSDDGRLLQVEYGMEASRRGNTVACLDLSSEQNSKICFVVAAAEESGDDDTEELSFSDKVHRLDEHALLITTGLSGDGRALAQTTRVACQRMRLSRGEIPPVAEIAALIGEVQHELTRTGGARPFAVTATVVGVDAILNQPLLFQSEPGGVVEECTSCASGKGREDAESSLVLLRHKLISLVDSEDDDILEDMVEGVASIVYDANKKTKRVDIWVVEAKAERRGGARIQCARGVRRDDLVRVKKMFAVSANS